MSINSIKMFYYLYYSDVSAELVLSQNIAVSEIITIQRLKEFSYYLVEEIEADLELCLKLLEERSVPVKSNSKYVFVMSKLASIIPKIGTGLGTGISEVEKFFLNRTDKKDSRALAHLVHSFDDDREKFRRVLIGAATEIFCSYEDQFRKLTCSGRERRAMQKLAKAASRRVFNYLLDKEKGTTFTKTDVIKGE